MPLRCCYLAVVLLVSCGATLCAQTETGQEFKAKILAEWNSRLESISTARWETRIEYHSPRDSKPMTLNRVDVIRVAFNRSAGILLSVEVEYFDDTMKVTKRNNDLDITNPYYTAELRSPKGGGAGWVLTKIDLQGKNLAEKFRCPWMVAGNVLLSQWIPDASFNITRIEELPGRPASHVLRAHFVYEPSRRQRPDLPEHIQSGYVDFDAANSYRPASYEYQLKNKVIINGVTRGKLEYEDGEGIPVLKVITSEEAAQTVRKGSISGKEIHTYSNVKYNVDVREQEFRLSNYGLPEPIGVTWKKPTPTYVWILIGAGISAVLAFALRYLAKRKRTAVN